MQPYAKASEELIRQKERGAQLAATAGGIAAFGLKGKVLQSLLNKALPSNVAARALRKASPLLKDFFNTALKKGYDESEVIDHIREKVPEEKAKTLFEEILGDVEVSSLPEEVQNQLGFLQMVAEKMEKQGVGKNDPKFKLLAKKVKSVLKGDVGAIQGEAMAQGGQMPRGAQPQMQGAQAQAQGQQQGSGLQGLVQMIQEIRSKLG